MNKINWRIRFSKKNITFILRFIAALLIPVLAYMGINYDDLTTWASVGKMISDFFLNPFLLGLTFVNAINLIPDPTTPGLFDSWRALSYDKPGKDTDKERL